MGKGKLWHPANQKPLNRSSPNLIHVITSYTRSFQGFLLLIYAKYTPSDVRMFVYLSFFVFVGSSNRLPSTRQHAHSRLIRHSIVVYRPSSGSSSSCNVHLAVRVWLVHVGMMFVCDFISQIFDQSIDPSQIDLHHSNEVNNLLCTLCLLVGARVAEGTGWGLQSLSRQSILSGNRRIF